MKILLIHFGEPWECIASTSILKGLIKKYNNPEISYATNKENNDFLKYNNKIKQIFVGDKLVLGKYDISINFTPQLDACCIASFVDAHKKYGFIEIMSSLEFCDENAEEAYNILYKNKKTSRTILQVLYSLCGMTWKGEGYDLIYYPKTKVKDGKTGIAIKNESLRRYVKRRLNLSLSDMWHVPMKKNLLKRIDEINRCKNIVTDDVFCLHASIALKKYVEFLDTQGMNINVEFFGKGNVIGL